MKIKSNNQTSGQLQRNLDIKNPKQAEQRIEVLISSIYDQLVTYDRDWRFTFVNAAAARLLGMPREKLLGKIAWELFPEAIGNRYYEELQEAARTKKPLTSEHFYPPINKWFETHIYPSEEGVTVFASDITERKRTEELLRESEQKYHDLFESIDQGYCIIEVMFDKKNRPLDFRPIEVNKAFEKQSGLKNAVDKSVHKLIPHLEKYWFEIFGNVALTGRPVRVENKVEQLQRWFDVYVFRMGKPEERKVGILFTDITERKKAHDALKESEASLIAAQRLGKMGSWELDLYITDDVNKNELRWSDECYRIFGFKPREVKVTNDLFFSLVHPEDRQQIVRAVAYAIKNKKTYSITHRIILPDGSERIIYETGKAIFDKKGNPIRMMGTAQDVTKQKKAEEALQRSELRFKTLTNLAPVGIFETDAEGNCIYVNERMCEIAGFTPEQAWGQGLVKALHVEDKERVFKDWTASARNKKEVVSEYRLITPEGKVTWIHGTALTLKAQGKITGYIGTVTDITDQKRLERQKDEFMGIASHELKTPVTSIKAYTQVLQKSFARKGDTEAAEFLRRMDSQLDKLTSLIADLLDVTKIQGGKLQFNETYFDFNELVNEIVEEVQRTTERHTLLIATAKTKTIFGDRDRLGQVLTNLLTNAIKYSPDGGKIITKTKTDKDTVTLSVQDFGLGISKDKQDKIFERFYRVPGDKEGTIPGIGLGLYISSEIIRRQGGKIWVESTEEEGSTFSFQLPIVKRKK